LSVYYFILALNLNTEIECKKLHITLLDLSTLFRIMGRLSGLFADDVNFQNRFNQSESLVSRYIKKYSCIRLSIHQSLGILLLFHHLA